MLRPSQNKIILVFLILGLFSMYCLAQDLSLQMRFARQLMDMGEYYRAITEYYRINSYFPHNPYYRDNMKQVARCYYLGAHKEESLNLYLELLKDDSLDFEIQWHIARIYHETGRYRISNDFLSKYFSYWQDSQRDSLFLLSSINHICLRDFTAAREVLTNVPAGSPLQQHADYFEHVMHVELPLPYKSKTKATIINLVIPGSGYIYAERTGTGITAMLINGLFAYLTYDSFKSNRPGIGVASGIIFLTFYIGSTYGAVNTVDQYNTRVFEQFRSEFRF